MSYAVQHEVNKLVDIYKSIQTSKDQEKERQLAMQPRREIREAKPRQICAFWCNVCRKDYNATGSLIIEGHGQTASAVYQSQCPDGHDNYRYITDIGHDPYFTRSYAVQHDRALHANDLLTPNDDNFKRLYRQQWLAIEEQREQRDRASTT